MTSNLSKQFFTISFIYFIYRVGWVLKGKRKYKTRMSAIFYQLKPAVYRCNPLMKDSIYTKDFERNLISYGNKYEDLSKS